MSQNLAARLNGVVKAKLKSIANGKAHDFDVSACYAPVLHPQTQQVVGFEHSWLVTVSMPNPVPAVVGPTVDVAVSFPIHGVVPPDIAFETITEQLFERCLEKEREALNPPALPDLPKAEPAPAVHVEREPEKPKRARERVSNFPSKPGSGDLSAES